MVVREVRGCYVGGLRLLIGRFMVVVEEVWGCYEVGFGWLSGRLSVVAGKAWSVGSGFLQCRFRAVVRILIRRYACCVAKKKTSFRASDK